MQALVSNQPALKKESAERLIASYVQRGAQEHQDFENYASYIYTVSELTYREVAMIFFENHNILIDNR